MNLTTVLIGFGIVFYIFFWPRFSFKRTINKVDMEGVLIKDNLDAIWRVIMMVRAFEKYKKDMAIVLGVSKMHLNYIVSFIQKHSDVKIKKMKPDDITATLLSLGFYYEMDAEGRKVAKIKSDLSDEDIFFQKAVSLLNWSAGGPVHDTSGDVDYWKRRDEDYDRNLAIQKGQFMGGYRVGDGRRGMDERR